VSTEKFFPIPENLDFSLYEIANILDLKVSGQIFDRIRDALKSIATTTIESKGTYCYLESGERRSINKLFGIYDSVIFIGESLPDGTVADRNRVDFNEWYLKALNSFYIKPLDFPYWKSLRSDIARRLYEYLSFISFATKCEPCSIEYHRLSELLPVTPQRYLSLAKHCLKKAHQELMETGFLKKVVWRKSKTDSKKWIIEYHFGMRAKLELQRRFKDDTYRPVILAVETAEIDEIEELIESEEKVTGVKRKKKTQEDLRKFDPTRPSFTEEEIEQYRQDYKEKFPQRGAQSCFCHRQTRPNLGNHQSQIKADVFKNFNFSHLLW